MNNKYDNINVKANNELCFRKTHELISIFDKLDINDEDNNLDLINKFFSEYKDTLLPPPDIFDHISECTFKSKLRCIEEFRVFFITNQYFEAAHRIIDFNRHTVSLFEPAARGMLLTAWRILSEEKNDI